MKTQLLHSKTTGYSVVLDADDGMAVQIAMADAESAARLAVLLESAAKYANAWNADELAAYFHGSEVMK